MRSLYADRWEIELEDREAERVPGCRAEAGKVLQERGTSASSWPEALPWYTVSERALYSAGTLDLGCTICLQAVTDVTVHMYRQCLSSPADVQALQAVTEKVLGNPVSGAATLAR